MDKENISEYTLESIMRTNAFEYVLDYTLDKTDDLLELFQSEFLKDDEKPITREFQLKTRTGKIKWLSINITPIKLKEEIVLAGNEEKEIIVDDERRLIAIYPYRDADFSKIMPSTENILVMSCGVPGIAWETVQAAGHLAKEFLERFC